MTRRSEHGVVAIGRVPTAGPGRNGGEDAAAPRLRPAVSRGCRPGWSVSSLLASLPPVIAVRGRVGDCVFKTYGRRIIVTRVPRFDGYVPSPAQRRQREQMRAATAYAQTVYGHAAAKAFYVAAAGALGRNPFRLAISDCLSADDPAAGVRRAWALRVIAAEAPRTVVSLPPSPGAHIAGIEGSRWSRAMQRPPHRRAASRERPAAIFSVSRAARGELGRGRRGPSAQVVPASSLDCSRARHGVTAPVRRKGPGPYAAAFRLSGSHETPGRCSRTPHRVIHEDAAEAAIAEDGAAKISDLRRGLQPAGGLRVEFAQSLQFVILPFRQQLDAHGRSQMHGAVFRFEFRPGLQRVLVVAGAGAAGRALRGAVEEEKLPGFRVVSHDIRFTAGRFHLAKRPQLLRLRFHPGLHLGPFHPAWRSVCFSNRAFKVLSRSSRCPADSVFWFFAAVIETLFLMCPARGRNVNGRGAAGVVHARHIEICGGRTPANDELRDLDGLLNLISWETLHLTPATGPSMGRLVGWADKSSPLQKLILAAAVKDTTSVSLAWRAGLRPRCRARLMSRAGIPRCAGNGAGTKGERASRVRSTRGR